MWKSSAFLPWPSMSIGKKRSPSRSAALRNSVGTLFCEAPKKNGTRTPAGMAPRDRKSTRLNSSHGSISYAVFCLKKKKKKNKDNIVKNTDMHENKDTKASTTTFIENDKRQMSKQVLQSVLCVEHELDKLRSDMLQ